jgi:isoquinoline 1-oxidoreductase beta subunit
MKRRSFLVGGALVAAAGGGLFVGVGRLVGDRVGDPGSLPVQPDSVGLNGWVRVGTDGVVTVTMAKTEMGQGISTALPMIVADEMDVPLSLVRVEPAGLARRYGNRAVFDATWWFHPDNESSWLARRLIEMGEANGALLGVQITGHSSSVSDSFETLRHAGAAARAMLVAAAAARWNVAPQECITVAGGVVHRNVHDGIRSSAARLGYGALALEAARYPVPGDIEPKSPKQRVLVGTKAPRLDIPDKVTGKAVYGIDVRLPGMLHAAVRGCPVPGGSLGSLDSVEAEALPGVVKVLSYAAAAGCAPGVGVIAANSWQAQLAVSAVKIDWKDGALAPFTGEALIEDMRNAFVREKGVFVFHQRGDGAKALDRATRTMHGDYLAPWLAHATMEPMNCTAQWLAPADDRDKNPSKADANLRLKIWVPTQAPSLALDTAARVSGLDRAQIELQVTQIGGGFGRRLETDYLVPAIALARAVAPAPVQVLWSREEDMTHDFYRPAAVCRLQAGFDEQGRLFAWRTRSVSDAVTPQFLGRNFPLMAKASSVLPDRTQAEGLWDQPYEIPHRFCDHVTVATPVPIGNWRSVGHSHMAFFAESFIDELAHAAGTDPLAFRRGLLTAHPRHLAVLALAAQKAGWGSALAPGRALGLALHESFGTIVAQVAEVSIEDARPRVHRVVCALDCGTVVNPGIVAQQVEGSVIFALSACLHGAITFRDSRVEQSNFPSYEMVRLREAPLVETWIVPSEAPPSGVGEPATPPLAPAVANALFTLTGQRLRTLPLRLA